MRATKAYIASLGTTGVLLAASILMLAVVSAVVAFDRWPNGTVSTRVQTLVLTDRATPIRVTPGTAAAGSAGGTTAAGRTAGAGAPGARAPGAHAVAPTVAGRRFTGGRTPATTVAPGRPATPVGVSAPDLPSLDPTNPKGVANQLAQQTESATGSLGAAVGQINPGAGSLVTELGQKAADTLGTLPLPGH
jgi:hypothetical protein